MTVAAAAEGDNGGGGEEIRERLKGAIEGRRMTTAAAEDDMRIHAARENDKRT